MWHSSIKATRVHPTLDHTLLGWRDISSLLPSTLTIAQQGSSLGSRFTLKVDKSDLMFTIVIPNNSMVKPLITIKLPYSPILTWSTQTP